MSKQDWSRVYALLTIANGLFQLKFPSDKPGMVKNVEVNGVLSKRWTAVQYGMSVATIVVGVAWMRAKSSVDN
jgi:hypothetical protein